MDVLVFLTKYTIFVFANVMQLALLARAILSRLDPEMEWRISSFLYGVTEFAIRPVRLLCQRMHWFEGTMMDVPFFITVLLMALLEFLTWAAL